MLEVGETAVGRGRGEPWSLLEVTSRSAASAGEAGAVVARPPLARGRLSLEEEDLGPLRLCPRSRGALGSGAPPGLMHGRGFELEVMPYGVQGQATFQEAHLMGDAGVWPCRAAVGGL